jgi:hypothetical protein
MVGVGPEGRVSQYCASRDVDDSMRLMSVVDIIIIIIKS